LRLKFGTSLTSQGSARISETILNSLRLYDVVYIYQKTSEIKSEIKNVFIADLAIIILCEIDIFIEISISVRNLFSKTSYNRILFGALKLA